MARPKILIVDDDTTIAGMFGVLLEGEGFQTVIVHGTSSAINIIRREKPDLVLLDVMVPGVSGLELCSYIRREPDLKDLPVIMVSARHSPEDVQRGLDSGATIYLIKPVSRKDLMDGINQALRKGMEPAAR
ncbi:MAG: response regulator [Anaerolineales bacterium]|nr:response regulator [Anaerolineales bacterium]